MDPSRLNRQDLARRTGRLEQVGGTRLVEMVDGSGRGNRLVEVRTAAGLAFDVSADRGLDITSFSYRGVQLAWLSPAGTPAPHFFEPDGIGWLRTFPGGLLLTCGMDTYGSPSEDQGEAFGQHGRATALPARNLAHGERWQEDGRCRLEVSGEMVQARVFGEHLVLRRTVTTYLDSARVDLEDEVENAAFHPQPHMVLYHFNLGYPLIDDGARLVVPAAETTARDEVARQGLERWSALEPPTPDYQEQVFRHRVAAGADGWAAATVENPGVGLALRIHFRPEQLPHLFQWKMMGEGIYVLGVEPGNSSSIEGRAAARARGDLPVLQPGERRRYQLSVEVESLAG